MLGLLPLITSTHSNNLYTRGLQINYHSQPVHLIKDCKITEIRRYCRVQVAVGYVYKVWYEAQKNSIEAEKHES